MATDLASSFQVLSGRKTLFGETLMVASRLLLSVRRMPDAMVREALGAHVESTAPPKADAVIR